MTIEPLTVKLFNGNFLLGLLLPTFHTFTGNDDFFTTTFFTFTGNIDFVTN